VPTGNDARGGCSKSPAWCFSLSINSPVAADQVRAYVAGLAHVTKPGGRLFLLCFSDEEPGTQGPRRVSERELREAFAIGWIIEEIRPERFEVVADLEDISFSEGGPKAWFSVIRREG
jgi:hypothetical protein